MIQRLRKHQSTWVGVMAWLAVAAWLAADSAYADPGDKAKGRSGGRSASSSSSSASSGSSGSSGSSSRRAVSRSGSSRRTSARGGSSRSTPPRAHGRSGASRTRTGHDRARGRRGGGRHGHRDYFVGFGYGGYSRYGYGYGYGFGYPSYWHPFWGYWGWGHSRPGPVVYSSRPEYGLGALDLNVDPRRTEIYVDGQYIGLARQYDGFPSYLWLEKGIHEIAFYRPGYETQTRQVKVLPSLVLDMDIEMYEGEAVKPELRLEGYPEDREGEESGDEIVRRFSKSKRGDSQARLHLDVEPLDARVYLDGHFLGTGDELAGLRAGLILSAGVHTLEVEQPGYERLEQRLMAEAGEDLELILELAPSASVAIR